MQQSRLCALLVCLAAATPIRAGELRVGAAAEVITPAPGTPLAGYYEHREATGVHDDLYAKAIVIERDGVKAAMVVCDLLTLPRTIVDDARRLIAEKPGIPADRVMISATHTHTGPIVRGPSGEDPLKGDDADKTVAFARVAARADRRGRAQRRREAHARGRVGGGGAGGARQLQPAVLHEGRHGRLEPDEAQPEGRPPGRADRPGRAGRLLRRRRTAAGRSRRTSASPCTSTPSPALEISADYPATIASILGKVKGPDMVTVFATGACGDINHLDNSSTDKQRGNEEAARIGTVLAGEAIKTYARLKPRRRRAAAGEVGSRCRCRWWS